MVNREPGRWRLGQISCNAVMTASCIPAKRKRSNKSAVAFDSIERTAKRVKVRRASSVHGGRLSRSCLRANTKVFLNSFSTRFWKNIWPLNVFLVFNVQRRTFVWLDTVADARFEHFSFFPADVVALNQVRTNLFSVFLLHPVTTELLALRSHFLNKTIAAYLWNVSIYGIKTNRQLLCPTNGFVTSSRINEFSGLDFNQNL